MAALGFGRLGTGGQLYLHIGCRIHFVNWVPLTRDDRNPHNDMQVEAGAFVETHNIVRL